MEKRPELGHLIQAGRRASPEAEAYSEARTVVVAPARVYLRARNARWDIFVCIF